MKEGVGFSAARAAASHTIRPCWGHSAPCGRLAGACWPTVCRSDQSECVMTQTLGPCPLPTLCPPARSCCQRCLQPQHLHGTRCQGTHQGQAQPCQLPASHVSSILLQIPAQLSKLPCMSHPLLDACCSQLQAKRHNRAGAASCQPHTCQLAATPVPATAVAVAAVPVRAPVLPDAVGLNVVSTCQAGQQTTTGHQLLRHASRDAHASWPAGAGN